MCVVRRMFGAQAFSVVRWLFGCGLVGLLVVLIVQDCAGFDCALCTIVVRW